MIKQLVWVALGGGMGSVLRYMTSLFAMKYLPHALPWATFLVNIVGCLLIGIFVGLANRCDMFSGNMKLVWIVGFCGGYTTFSTFSVENLRLFEAGSYVILALYVVASVLLGLAAVWAGMALSK